MDQLIARLQEKVGISEAAAKRAVEVVIEFLSREAPADTMAELSEKIPGVAGIIACLPDEATLPASTRHFGGMARLMQVADHMMAAGMTMPQIQEATREVVAYAREQAGDEVVDRIVVSIPGLRQIA